jgi:hypothetical protein
MSELESMADRIRAARERLRRLPQSESHEQGPPDPKTGERWDRLNVLGHTAEVLEFWSAEIPRAVAAGDVVGRQPGSAGRMEGIEGGRLIGEEKLRERIEAGTETAIACLGNFKDEQLDHMVETRNQGTIPLRRALEIYVVGHLEEHVNQLTELPS